MAYERTWQFLPVQNYTPSSAYDHTGIFYSVLKRMLMGQLGTATQGLWTLAGSNDGVTYGYDTTDRWGSTVFATNDSFNNSSGVKPWVILTRTINGKQVWLTLMCTVAGSTNSLDALNFRLTGTIPSGGNTTTIPTFTNVIVNVPSTILPGTGTYLSDFTSPRRIYGGMTTLGDFWIAQTVAGNIEHGALIMGPVGCKINDLWPIYGHGAWAVDVSGFGPFYGDSLYNINPGGSAIQQGLYYTGVAAYPLLATPYTYPQLDASDISLYDFPAWVMVYNSTPNPTAMHARGRLPDIGLTSGITGSSLTQAAGRPCAVGTTVRDGGGNVQYVTLNQVIVPYNTLLA